MISILIMDCVLTFLVLLPLLLAVSGMPVFGGARPVPFNPTRLRYGEWGAALVALAGPLTNFILAFFSFGLFAVVMPADGSALSTILSTSVVVNLGFFVFNMIPIPPLDGSRFMYALAPDFARRGMEAIERMGVVVIFAIVMLASPLISQLMGSATRAIIHLFSALFGMSS